MSNPSQPQPQPTAQVTIRRSPRYLRFMGVGAILGLVLALILTMTFEAGLDYTRTQIFGFLALLAVVLFGTLGGIVALVLDRVGSRRASTVEAERVNVHSQQEGDADDAARGTPPTGR
ncbi:hypothetical protein [Planctomonas psychrotolerans]|uniref:hypothetical protein n=1 Tax=Planctomonas psychrotolerans TaxID=2528712 RepID=UPI001D0D417E|nr:hypothetical protein [Planctomonas psychrotolerans]